MFEEQQTIRKWYQKKRFIIPLSGLGLFILIGVLVPSTPSQTSVQSKTEQTTQVKGDTVKLPAPITPLTIQQEQPATETQTTPPPTLVTPPPAVVQKAIPPPVQQQAPPTYYTNVDGNRVQSPTKTPDNSVPTDATARCRDGSFSYSQHRSGTCSHHGGVAEWL